MRRTMKRAQKTTAVQTEREANFRRDIAYTVNGKTQVDANLSGTAKIEVEKVG